MNIKMQICGLFVLLLIAYFYNSEETVGLDTEKIFHRALGINIACLLLDMLSIVLILNRDRIPITLVNAECKMYLVSLVWTGYMAYAYAKADTFKENNRHQIGEVFAVVISIVICITPIYIFHEKDIVYTYGPACISTYIGAVVLVVMTLANVIINGALMNPRRRKAIKTWLVMWIVAAAIQFFNSQILLVGFASTMGIFILFFELENPESNIDRKTGFFNSIAFSEYLSQKYNNKQNICGLLVSLENVRTKELKARQIDDVIYDITAFFRRVPDSKIFKLDEREFAFIFDYEEEMDRGYRIIDERFQQEWTGNKKNEAPVVISPYYIKVPSIEVAENNEDMLGILKYFRAHMTDNPEIKTIVINDESVARKSAREEMLNTMMKAMDDDRVEVFFQPIYSTYEKKFVSAEALVRIRREDGSIIPPGLFIPVAEETGFIAKIGERVFEKTCKFIKEKDINKYGIEYIEVNLSVVQCEDRELAGMYIDIMNRYKVDPALINLEITESASIVMRNILLENMNALIDYGVSFSLDDFGNGESNLNYIMDLPVSIVKFDRDMINAYFDNEKAKYVLQAATDMIQGLQLKVVAEGVEMAEQLKELERLGIDYIQGYYFSKPIESCQFIEFLKAKGQY